MNPPPESDFEKIASRKQKSSLFSELLGLIKDNKKYWMLPILIILVIFGVLVILSGTGLAPFIYTLF